MSSAPEGGLARRLPAKRPPIPATHCGTSRERLRESVTSASQQAVRQVPSPPAGLSTSARAAQSASKKPWQPGWWLRSPKVHRSADVTLKSQQTEPRLGNRGKRSRRSALEI